jgi:hypothetical protein
MRTELFGPKGRKYGYEIDMWIHNSEIILFEIKFYAESEDAVRFNDKAELYCQKKGITNPLKVFIRLDKSRDMIRTCEELGIELL